MPKLKKAEIQPLVDKLLELYPNAECALHFGTVYQLIVAVALSAQTTDKSVNEVTPALFERCPDAHAMAQISEEEMRKKEIEDLEAYVGTDEYVEDVAKDKLGLVYPDEILFEAE